MTLKTRFSLFYILLLNLNLTFTLEAQGDTKEITFWKKSAKKMYSALEKRTQNVTHSSKDFFGIKLSYFTLHNFLKCRKSQYGFKTKFKCLLNHSSNQDIDLNSKKLRLLGTTARSFYQVLSELSAIDSSFQKKEQDTSSFVSISEVSCTPTFCEFPQVKLEDSNFPNSELDQDEESKNQIYF